MGYLGVAGGNDWTDRRGLGEGEVGLGYQLSVISDQLCSRTRKSLADSEKPSPSENPAARHRAISDPLPDSKNKEPRTLFSEGPQFHSPQPAELDFSPNP
jgi:hypothetical protein